MSPSEDETRLSRRLFLAGTAGTAVATGVSASALAQEDNETDTGDGNETDSGGNETDTEDGNETAEDGGGEGNESEEGGEGNESEGGGGGGGATETVEVDDNEFVPDSLSVEPGSTVIWEWVGEADHNVAPSSVPDEASWEGQTDLQSEGTYEHTFDTEGTYEYICEPHVGVGMTGSIEVAEGAGGGEGGAISVVPDAAWTLLVATLAGVLSTLSLVYGFMRYGGDSGE